MVLFVQLLTFTLQFVWLAVIKIIIPSRPGQRHVLISLFSSILKRLQSSIHLILLILNVVISIQRSESTFLNPPFVNLPSHQAYVVSLLPLKERYPWKKKKNLYPLFIQRGFAEHIRSFSTSHNYTHSLGIWELPSTATLFRCWPISWSTGAVGG